MPDFEQQAAIGGILQHALELALQQIAKGSGGDALISEIYAQTAHAFKTAGLPDERQMDQANIVTPALDAVFEPYLRK